MPVIVRAIGSVPTVANCEAAGTFVQMHGLNAAFLGVRTLDSETADWLSAAWGKAYMIVAQN